MDLKKIPFLRSVAWKRGRFYSPLLGPFPCAIHLCALFDCAVIVWGFDVRANHFTVNYRKENSIRQAFSVFFFHSSFHFSCLKTHEGKLSTWVSLCVSSRFSRRLPHNCCIPVPLRKGAKNASNTFLKALAVINFFATESNMDHPKKVQMMSYGAT